MNIGMKPTFHDLYTTIVEVHFFNFSGDLYESEIMVQIVERLRDERKFNGINELLMQLKKDRVKAELILLETLL